MEAKSAVLHFNEAEDFKGTLRTFLAPPDQVAFERHYGVGMGKFEAEERVEWILWLIWKAFSREHPTQARPFDAFLEDLIDFDLPGDVTPEQAERARAMFDADPTLQSVNFATDDGGTTVTRDEVRQEATPDPTGTPPLG